MTQAVKSITKNGHVLSLTFSEAITDEAKENFKEMFRYKCVRAGDTVKPDDPMGYDNGTNRSKMDLLDENGKPISKVVLDSMGRATFYVIANAPVTGATLQAKGAASSAATWTDLVFKEPPIPRISSAIFIDRNGDGRGDSLHIKFNKELGGKNNLDSLKFAFGEGFPVQTKENWKVSSNNTELSIVSSSTCEPYKL